MSLTRKQQSRSAMKAGRVRGRSFSSSGSLNSLWANSDTDASDCSEKGSPTRPRRVSFSKMVDVALIPCKAEYREACIDDLVWWNESDFSEFKQTLGAQFRAFLSENTLPPNMSTSAALKFFIARTMEN